MKSPAIEGRRKREQSYVLDDQVGFLLRQAHQRHTTIFATEMIEDLTPTQWAALAKLRELGAFAESSRPPDRDGRRYDQGRDRSSDRSRLHHDRPGPARRPPSPRRTDTGGLGALRTHGTDRYAHHSKDARTAGRIRTRGARRFVAAPRLD